MEGAEDPLFQEAMAMSPFYLQEEGEMGEEERAELASLRNKEFLPLTGAEEKAVALGLLDLLLAFAYDHRTTGGEPTVESCWTLATLSPALCWLETWRATAPGEGDDDDDRDATIPPPALVAAVVRSFYRRSLTYPYLRLWALSERCVADARAMLLAANSRRRALRCLLRVRAWGGGSLPPFLVSCVVLCGPAAPTSRRNPPQPNTHNTTRLSVSFNGRCGARSGGPRRTTS